MYDMGQTVTNGSFRADYFLDKYFQTLLGAINNI